MDRIDLTNGLTIEIAASHLGTVRNYTTSGPSATRSRIGPPTTVPTRTSRS